MRLLPVLVASLACSACTARIETRSNAVAAAVIAVPLIAAGVEYNREPRAFPSPTALVPGNSEPVPALAPDRRVSEQDCTRPIDPAAGNLRCR